jgi:hypothetical protein
VKKPLEALSFASLVSFPSPTLSGGLEKLLGGAEKVPGAEDQGSVANFPDLYDFLLRKLMLKIFNSIIHVITFFDCRPSNSPGIIIPFKKNPERLQF